MCIRDSPDSVWEVLHQPGQFTPVEQGKLPKKADASCVEAVRRALAGEDPTGGALFFYNPHTCLLYTSRCV